MPAWIAGIQVHRMLRRHPCQTWIPALHAGMTESMGLELTGILHPVFSKEVAECSMLLLLPVQLGLAALQT
jgi:hypothetical protein